MYQRSLKTTILSDSQKYPVLALTGPRQSGKTTLVRDLFPDYTYVLLEETDLREMARSDPRGFFRRFSHSLILDEVQQAPELLSHIQGIVDDPKNRRQFVLTGSEHLQLSEKISQTLAGRVRTFHLLPLTIREKKQPDLLSALFVGGYPRIYDQTLEPSTWLGQYYSNYVQRDVRSVINIGDLETFDRYVRLLAGRAGQLLDLSSLSSDCGVSQPTAKSWLSVLQTTFICFTLSPHFRNFNKRIIKTPKIYFYDSGLLCYLLRIKELKHLLGHPLYGNIFENWAISERIKNLFHSGQESNLYFWRDHKGHEIDLVSDRGTYLFPTEIKSSETFHESFVKHIDYFSELQEIPPRSRETILGECIYGGTDSFIFKNNIKVTGWEDI